MIPTVYKIEFPDGKCYIGSTVNFPERRRTHLRHGRRGEAVNPRLAAQFQKYPICGIYQVATSKTREALHKIEQEVMFDEQPSLNMHISPTPLPAYYDGSAKPFGPYPSVRVAAHELGHPYPQLKRLARQFSYEAIIYKLAYTRPTRQKFGPPDPRKQTALINLGSGWDRRADILAEHGVTHSMYEHRVKRGWTPERALTTPPMPVIFGPPKPRDYYQKQEISPGVSLSMYNARLKLGWSDDEARGFTKRTQEINVKRRMLTADGRTQSMDAWAKELGVKKYLISGRLGLGWTDEQALGFTPSPKQLKTAELRRVADAKKRPVYEVNGVKGGVTELARFFGVPLHRAQARKKNGWPIEKWFIPGEDTGARETYESWLVLFEGRLVPRNRLPELEAELYAAHSE